ncbi:MAG: ABC transporter ATP-binding protein [Imperialibacter sp.]|uniref:ABC transporter ATP-binding protein n=1 Tax=Imperialibacter sp. TaxID=2038411 RepID=UPI0032EF5212
MSTAIKVENISKAYQLGQFSTGTLSRDLERWWALARGKEDPYLKLGETNVRSTKGVSNVVWSLKDISFEVEEGMAIGIIGKNGAGKSTLLKLLSQVTTPTTGQIKVRGRIASLLEVGTGFHPDLTGRENIFLNGAILGMRTKEIQKKFDEIVDFSGVERYIDTPVKRYSSGMYVRLAFAVAAHLESEILIVDEVLAVGDADFQRKCLGKMGEVSKGEGRTVLFVSHNMESVSKLCSEGILLENGTLKYQGAMTDIINQYLLSGLNGKEALVDLKPYNLTASYNTGTLVLENLMFENSIEGSNVFAWNKPIEIRVGFKVLKKVDNLVIGFTIATATGVNVFTANNSGSEFSFEANTEVKIRIKMDHNLRHGLYTLHLGALEGSKDIWWHTDIANLEITNLTPGIDYPTNNSGVVLCDSIWTIN